VIDGASSWQVLRHVTLPLLRPGLYQHIGYPSVCQLDDGTIVCAYHECTDEADPIQYILCTRFKLGD